MAKITTDKLVSLILEQINKSQDSNMPMYFNTIEDVENYYGFKSGKNSEIEMTEMANIKYEPEQLPEPMRIPIEQISPETQGRLPKIICKDPATDQFVENVIISDMVITLPNGQKMLKFYNYGEEQKLDRGKFIAHYVVIPEMAFHKHPPRSEAAGTRAVRNRLYTDDPNETPEQKETRMEKIENYNEGYAKRYVIHPAINNFFSQKEILDRLDICFIPEVWATDLRTERPTNVEKSLQFGGNGRSIKIEYYAIRDASNVDEAMDKIFKSRIDVEDAVENREREKSKTMPRSKFVSKGVWSPTQRIFDENEFNKAGRYTAILKLLKKNIQEGQKGLNVKSNLIINGDFMNDSYVLTAEFTAQLHYRPEERSRGVKVGELIDPPLKVELEQKIPENYINDENFSLRTNPGFFGRKGERGIFDMLLEKLGQEILTNLDPDDVLTKMSELTSPVNIDNQLLTPEA